MMNNHAEDDNSSPWSVLGEIINASKLDKERKGMLMRAEAINMKD